jgi:hypothetical protein
MGPVGREGWTAFAEASESWGTTGRFCVIVAVNWAFALAPIWLMTR